MNSSNPTASTDCCSGVEDATPRGIDNAPGLDNVDYRIGAQSDFKAAMLDALSGSSAGPLRALQTREDDDFTVALIDGWATALDVLTFYQERLANEGWLGTATDRRSVVELARLIGYEPRPGLAAEAALAFTLEDAEGAPRSVTLDAGVAVQSVPAPGEPQVTFETVEGMELRPEWNLGRTQRYAEVAPLQPFADFYWVKTATPGVKRGDLLLVLTKGPDKDDGIVHCIRCLKRVTGVATYPEDDRARIDVVNVLSPVIDVDRGDDNAIIVLGTKAAPFGHNAPRPQPQAKDSPTDWGVPTWDGKSFVLDRDIEGVPPDQAKVVAARLNANEWLYYVLDSITLASPAQFGISARVSQLAFTDPYFFAVPWLRRTPNFQAYRDTTFYIETQRLPLSGPPILERVSGSSLLLDRDYYVPALWDSRQTIVRLGYYPAAFQPGRRWIVRGQTGKNTAGSEIVVVSHAQNDQISGTTRCFFSQPLANFYENFSVTVLFNVVRATHGETVGEILGGGNGGQPWQQFTLRQGPLTYTGDGVASGGASTLEIQANGLIWREQASFFEAAPNDRVFTTLTDENAQTVVRFGDGRNGARLPSGMNNVRATYRKGSGAVGNVVAGQLSLLGSRPAGVRAVINPLPADGGVDPEPRDDARLNAPMTARTLDRVVSLQDYADYARAFAGIARADAKESNGRVLLTLIGPGGAVLTLKSSVVIRLAAALRQIGDPTVPVQIVSGRLFPLAFGASLQIAPDRVQADVLAAARASLVARFGFDRREIGDLLAQIDLLATLQQTPGVLAVKVTRFDAPDNRGDTAIWPEDRDGSLLLPAWIAWLDESQLQLTVS